ncbi:hypothetical protein [Blastococcus aggregatus]|uniref:hypothetical protein n=1 Tax=Blastococcus aggregatus TaxID=38502 RepID=UPI000BE46A93|nr:hypothetical protein [Blastococcus aggregatus]
MAEPTAATPHGVIAGTHWVIDRGPGAGNAGGTVVYQGPPADLLHAPQSMTGQRLAAYIGQRGRRFTLS